ncbi:hypothetical protein RFI_27247, partial [Reticulomyxa filosa]
MSAEESPTGKPAENGTLAAQTNGDLANAASVPVRSDSKKRLSLEEKALLKQMRKQKADFHQRIRQLTGSNSDESYLKGGGGVDFFVPTSPRFPSFLKKKNKCRNRHEIIQEIVAHLGHNMNVFDSQRSANEWLTDATMDSLPIFWFKVEFFFFQKKKKKKGKKKTGLTKFGRRNPNIVTLAPILNPKLLLKKKKKVLFVVILDRLQVTHIYTYIYIFFFFFFFCLFANVLKVNPFDLVKVKTKQKHIRKDSKLYLRQQQMSIRHRNDRSSSMILSKQQQSEALGIKIWNKFVQSRGGVTECTSINENQWNIALNDNGIEVNPDLSLDLYIALLDAKEKIDKWDSEDSAMAQS